MRQQRKSAPSKGKKKKKRKKRKNRPGSGGALFKVLMVISLFLIGVASALGFVTYNDYMERQAIEVMKHIVEKDVIYEHIFVNGMSVGGMTKTQAVQELENAYQKPLEEQSLRFFGGKEDYTFYLSEFDAGYDIEAAVEVAYYYARFGTLKERYDKINGLEDKPYEITAEYSFNESLLRAVVTDIEAKEYTAPADASIERKDRTFNITSETSGLALNADETLLRANALLDDEKGGDVEMAFTVLSPMFTATELKNAQSLIGTFYTTFQPGENGRNTNIKNAISKIDGIVVYPGGVFSTNKAFGPSTEANGYRAAPVIVRGKLVDDIGGGVCQVSSTLYNAILYAELEIVERQNHSLKVGYTDYGYDATLAGDYIDLKFKNNTALPVTIESYVENNSRVVVNIYGLEEHSPSRRLVFQNALVESVPPAAEIITEDPTLPQGERRVIQKASTGYRYQVYKIVYENEKEIEKVRVNTSYYVPVRGEVRVGTKQTDTDATAAVSLATVSNQQLNQAIQNTNIDQPVMPD